MLTDDGTVDGRRRFRCLCACGNQKVVASGDLLNARVKSCGCLRRELAAKKALLRACDGKAPERAVWLSMIDRCTNPKARAFAHYGARGITVWGGWLDYRQFLADMGRRPSPRHSLDRIDNDKGYSPENCRWATAAQQMRNTRRSRINEKQARHCAERSAKGESYRAIARSLDVDPELVRLAVRRVNEGAL